MLSQNQHNMDNSPNEILSGGELSAGCTPRYQCVARLLLDSDEVYACVHTQTLHNDIITYLSIVKATSLHYL